MLAPVHDSYLTQRKLSSGAAARIIGQILELLPGGESSPITNSLATARDSTSLLVASEQAFATTKATREGRYSSAALAFDAALDRQLSALHSTCVALHTSAQEGSVEKRGAATLLQQCFPEGLGAIVNDKLSQQHATVVSIVGKLRGGLASTVEAVGVPKVIIDRIADLSDKLGNELSKVSQDDIAYQDVRAHAATAHRDLLRVVVQIFATYPGDNESDLNERSRLLAPLAIALEEARVDFNARRRRGADDGGGEAEDDAS